MDVGDVFVHRVDDDSFEAGICIERKTVPEASVHTPETPCSANSDSHPITRLLQTPTDALAWACTHEMTAIVPLTTTTLNDQPVHDGHASVVTQRGLLE